MDSSEESHLRRQLAEAELMADPTLFNQLQKALSSLEAAQQANKDLKNTNDLTHDRLETTEQKLKDSTNELHRTQARVEELEERGAVYEAQAAQLNSDLLCSKANNLQAKQTVRALKLEGMKYQDKIAQLEAKIAQKEIQAEHLFVLLQDVYLPADKLFQSLADIKARHAHLQKRLKEQQSVVNATEAEKLQMECELDAARTAHNQEVEKMKENYEARLGDLHTALQSNTTLASSIEDMRQTFAKTTASNADAARFVRRQSLDNKIQALEARIASATDTSTRSMAPPKTKPKASKKGRSTNTASSTKSQPKSSMKKQKTNVAFEEPIKHTASAFDAAEHDHDDIYDNDISNDDDFQEEMPVSSHSTTTKPSYNAEKGIKKQAPKRKAPANNKKKDNKVDLGMDLLAMYDNAAGSSSSLDAVDPSPPKQKRSRQNKTKPKTKRKPNPKPRPKQVDPQSRGNALKPSWRSNSRVPNGFAATSKAVPESLSKIDASPIGGHSRGTRLSVSSLGSVDSPSQRSATTSMFGSFLEAFKVPKVRLGGKATKGRGSRRRR